MRLGSAFQKVNFLRDLKDDNLVLNRTYFPGVDLNSFDEQSKKAIINETPKEAQMRKKREEADRRAAELN